MTTPSDQFFESYVPVYDAVPETWEDGREFLVEHLKKISNAVNIREIGWLLDEELLAGKQFIPGTSSANNQTFRSVFRKVIDTGALVAGLNPGKLHGIKFDTNFTLVDLWVSATQDATPIANTFSDPSNVSIGVTNINIISPLAYDRSFAFVEYLLEI